jgi:hypothetical protein
MRVRLLVDLLAVFSYRVAIRRQSLSRLKKRSMRLRSMTRGGAEGTHGGISGACSLTRPSSLPPLAVFVVALSCQCSANPETDLAKVGSRGNGAARGRSQVA